MQGTIRNLMIVLIAQIGLIALVLFRGNSLDAFSTEEKLLNLTQDELTGITIYEGKDKKLVLKKENGTWVIPDYNSFPAAKSKIAQTIGELLKTIRSWPVAQTESAAKKLKLTEEEFDRKIDFAVGDQVTTFYLGTSPTYKKVHAKLADQPETYVINFGTYQLGADQADWLDKEYLTIPDDQIAVLEVNDLKLSRVENNWQLEGLGVEEEINTPEAQAAVNSIARLVFVEVLGSETRTEYNLEKPKVSAKITKTDGTTREYKLAKHSKEDFYVLKVSDQPYYFKVANFAADSVDKAKREAVVKKKEAAAAADTAAEGQVVAPQE
jgi:hypothetical protein